MRRRWKATLPGDPVAVMVACEHWLSTDEQSFDDATDQALAVVADDLGRRRLERAVARHPAGGAW